MFDPVGAIRKMIKLARERIIIEFAQPQLRDRLAFSLNPFGIGVNATPAIILGAGMPSHSVLKRSFLFTGKAMEVLFDGHTRLFEPIVIRKLPFKGRLTLEATRRKIDHLVVVIGPTSAGKSTLLGRLETDAKMHSEFGLEGDSWLFVHRDTNDLPRGCLKGVVLHYDLLRPHLRSIRTFDRNPWCDFLRTAEQITIITLMSPGDVLRARLVKGELDHGRYKKSRKKRHTELFDRYATPDFLRQQYGLWFEYCKRYLNIRRNLRLISDDRNRRIASADNWEAEFEKLYF
jgi:hypothetical protein